FGYDPHPAAPRIRRPGRDRLSDHAQRQIQQPRRAAQTKCGAGMNRPVRAAVKVDIETTEVREFPRPDIPPDGGLLRVEAAGVGGSDPEIYRRENTAPCIMGHENVGTIEEVGPLFEKRWNLRPGDRIALHEYLPCWRCEWCLRGDHRLCLEA